MRTKQQCDVHAVHECSGPTEKKDLVDEISENILRKLNVTVESVNFLNYHRGGARGRSNNYRRSEGRYRNSRNTDIQTPLKCRNCQSTEHLVRFCPTHFCQSWGGRSHDSWSKACPKYL